MPLAHPEALRFLVLADLTTENDVEFVLETFVDFARWQPGATLIVVGDGPERPLLERRISELGVAASVGLPGALPQSRLIELLQRTHIFVLPRQAGRPQTVPAALPVAMASGLCVIASDVGPVAKMLTDGVDGLLVAPGDRGALLRALHLVSGNEALRARLGERAARGVRGALRSA